jgi:5'(3')-deoxyribonucleotidase
MDGTLVDFRSGVARMPRHVLAAYEGHYDDIPGIFGVMDPMPGALDAFRRLAKQFDTYVLSTAPWENPSAWSDKLVWVKRHLGDAAKKRLILTHHKQLNRGDFLVDDRDARGVKDFAGEHLHFGSPRFPDWAAVVAYLQTEAVTGTGRVAGTLPNAARRAT